MVKRAKNPAQLTEEEKDMIDQIILITGAVFTYITTKNPKDVGENWILSTKSKKRVAGSYLLLNTRNIDVSQVVTPANLNKELAKNILDNANVKDPTDLTTHVEDSDETNTKPSGRPSVYRITQKVEQLKALMSKPEACDRIRKALVESGLIYKYLKFLLQTLYYAAREDRSVADKLFRAFAPDITKDSQIKESLEKFWGLDESDLDKVADEVVISTETYLRYGEFLFVSGVFDIMSKIAKKFIL
jgi:hypothetical protein